MGEDGRPGHSAPRDGGEAGGAERGRAQEECQQARKAEEGPGQVAGRGGGPRRLFQDPAYAGKFSELNADGFPIKNKEGEDLNKSQTKAATKDLDRHSKAHKQLLEKGDPDAFLSDLAEQVKALSLAVG